MDNQDSIIKQYIEKNCKDNKVDSLSKEIKHVFMPSLKEAFSCSYPSSKTVHINEKLWKDSSPEQKRNAIIHETSHIICHSLHGSKIKNEHGREWADCVRASGETPYNYFSELRDKSLLCEVSCACESVFLTKLEASKLPAKFYFCQVCREAIVVHNKALDF
jgi:predicted SprT family Zn-dependent metalloprotease